MFGLPLVFFNKGKKMPPVHIRVNLSSVRVPGPILFQFLKLPIFRSLKGDFMKYLSHAKCCDGLFQLDYVLTKFLERPKYCSTRLFNPFSLSKVCFVGRRDGMNYSRAPLFLNQKPLSYPTPPP